VAVALLAAAGTGLGAAACLGGGKDEKGGPPPPSFEASSSASASPSASASGSPPTSTTPTSTVTEFSVDGAGPYLIGATLDALKANPGLDQITTGAAPCPQNTTARGTGIWKDVQLSFHRDGTLYLATNTSSSVPTPSGAWLGTPLAQLKTIYRQVNGQQLNHGTSSAFLVTTLSGRGILFTLDPTMKVSSMIAGDSAYLRTNFTAGTAFC
jgi:hypothetical protein